MTTNQTPAVNARILARWGVEHNGTTTLRPFAKPVRAILRDAGLEQHIEFVGTGRNYCSLWLGDAWDNDDVKAAIVAALAPYWADGDTRVRASATRVLIEFRYYWAVGIPTPVQGAPDRAPW